MKKALFEGVATAIITPFTSDKKEVDYEAFEGLLEFQLKNSADAVVVSGTTGEAPVLSREEKIKLFRSAKGLCKNKIPVIAGTGSNNTYETVRKSNDAEKEGVDGLLIVTPYYNKCTQDGIIEHYTYVADRVSTPVIVYNVPSRTGVNILPETYLALSEHKNIIAVKEASNDIGSLTEAVSLCKNKLDFYTGNDNMTVAAMATGAKGVISVASNIIPDIMKRISQLCIDNDFTQANQLLLKYHKLLKALFCEVNPIPVKYACSVILNVNNSLRLPLTELSADNKKKLNNLLKEYNIIT